MAAALESGNPDEIAQVRSELDPALADVGNWSLSSPRHRGLGWEERIRAAFRTAPELAKEGGDRPEWVVGRWIAKGTITGIDGLPKGGGKTTFLLRLVAAVLDGRPFLGEACVKTKVVYLTEEPRPSFISALRRAGVLEHPDLHVLHRHAVMGAPWTDVVRAALAYCKAIGAGMLIVDTFPPFAGLRGDDENSAGAVLAALDPLQAVTAEGIAVILTRHERKALGEPGSSGRGSNAFTGGVETVITIRRPKGGQNPRAREIVSLSRFEEVPEAVTIELREEGFVVVGGAEPEEDLDALLLRLAPVSEADAKTEKDFTSVSGKGASTVNRSLNRLFGSGKLRRRGGGVKGDPHYYWAPRPGSFHSSQSPIGEEKEDAAGEDGP